MKSLSETIRNHLGDTLEDIQARQREQREALRRDTALVEELLACRFSETSRKLFEDLYGDGDDFESVGPGLYRLNPKKWKVKAKANAEANAEADVTPQP